MTKEKEKQLSRTLTEKFRQFIVNHPPSLVSRHLRGLLLDYMMQQQKIGFPLDFNNCLWELSDLFVLLDCAIDEWEMGEPKKG